MSLLTTVLVILAILIAVLLVNQLYYWKQTKAGKTVKTVRLPRGGGLFFFALFCGYGFLASSELQGNEEVAWKVAYGTLGIVSLVGAFYRASKGR